MTEEQKLNITAKLCQDVLGAVVDGIMQLESDHDVHKLIFFYQKMDVADGFILV